MIIDIYGRLLSRSYIPWKLYQKHFKDFVLRTELCVDPNELAKLGKFGEEIIVLASEADTTYQSFIKLIETQIDIFNTKFDPRIDGQWSEKMKIIDNLSQILNEHTKKRDDFIKSSDTIIKSQLTSR